MSRVRVSTTVDDELLARARALRAGIKDSELLDEALVSLLARHHEAQLDAEIAAGYDACPIDAPDEWGDLESWNEANDASPPR